VAGVSCLWPSLTERSSDVLVAGFDVIHALQAEFDKETVFRFPPAWGGPARPSTAFHAATICCYWQPRCGRNWGYRLFRPLWSPAFFLGTPDRQTDDLSRVNVAFFSLNGYVSILLLVTFATDILIR
jgi:hypothetical protein